MRHSESIAALAKALAAAQSEYITVPKIKTATVKMKSGGEFKYNYADLADCLAMAFPRLSKRDRLLATSRHFPRWFARGAIR